MPEDVDLIEEDLEDLRILFHAEGEGLETEEIVAMCVPLSDLLTVLQLDTGILVNNLKQVWAPACLQPCFSVRHLCKDLESEQTRSLAPLTRLLHEWIGSWYYGLTWY